MGFLVEGEDGNKSYLCGGCARVRAPRLVGLSFVGLLDVEGSKIDESNLKGTLMKPMLAVSRQRYSTHCSMKNFTPLPSLARGSANGAHNL